MYIKRNIGVWPELNLKIEIDFISPDGKRIILTSTPSKRKKTNSDYYILWGNSKDDRDKFGILKTTTYPKFSGAMKEFNAMIEASKSVTFSKPDNIND